MKKIVLIILALFICVSYNISYAQIKREHRAAWVSPYVGDWPAGPVTESNAAASKRVCNNMLDSLKVSNFNVIYYHVRAMSDAMYESSYEPWSSYVSTGRGVAPPYDIFEYLVEEAHKRGIEVYAWINPYRYAYPKNEDWGQSPLDYINTHPEWLLRNDKSTYLNPGLPDVRKRIVDVSREIITKYDVDGLVFDDYFYNDGGLPENATAGDYSLWKDSGTSLSFGDWRRENINMMVSDVNSMVKSTKPWVRFGVGPAGVAGSDPAVAAKYGVSPCPGSDWQYNQIYSDPLAWVSAGTIDFISPQLYWHIGSNPDFTSTARWWGMVTKKFNRHLYVSYTVPKDAVDLSLYLDELNVVRNVSDAMSPGHVYFHWITFDFAYEKIEGKIVRFRRYLMGNAFQNKALPPVLSWSGVYEPFLPSDIAYNDGVLSWKGKDGMRYVVYAIPETMEEKEFRKESDYILGISYSTEFSIPKEKQQGYKYAVAGLDRYSNEYTPVFIGASISDVPKAELKFPANGSRVDDLFNFDWTSDATSFVVQVAEDQEMSKIVYRQETDCKYLSSALAVGLESGKKYYWRVVSSKPNGNYSYSDIWSFVLDRIHITSISDGDTEVSLTPEISCGGVVDGATFTYEIWRDASMINQLFTETTTSNTFTIPKYTLCSGVKYYARVKAVMDGNERYSDLVSFSTVDIVHEVPVILNPQTDGQTMYSDSKIELKPVEGMKQIRYEISASTTFPPRSSFSDNIKTWPFESDKPLGGVKLSGSSLKDGQTYYVRARCDYNLTTDASVIYTDFTAPVSFVYNSGSSVDDVINNGKAYVSTGIDPVLIIDRTLNPRSVRVYSVSGVLADEFVLTDIPSNRYDIPLKGLLPGGYIINIENESGTTTVRFVK